MPEHKIIGAIARGRTTDVLHGIIVRREGFGSEVAIKRLREEFVGDEPMVRAFLNEARVGIALHHANVVDVFSASSGQGRPELIMQYLHGWSLETILKKTRSTKTPLKFEVAVAICHAMACGVAHMHELGLVHRHITPGNIMVTTGGCAKLIDFGGAISSHRKPASRYTPPEFFLGSQALDARGDIYSIGAILYEMTTGRGLFEATARPMEQIVRGNYEPPTSGRTDYPTMLAAIVKDCMSLNPDDRYQTAEALLQALEDFSADRRYTVSSRVVRAFTQRTLAPPTPLGQSTTSPPDTGSQIFFRRTPRASPPPLPCFDLTPVDLITEQSAPLASRE